MTILIIALAGVFPLLLCRLYTNNKIALSITAIVCSAIGIVTGNPIYAMLDVGVVAVATYLFWPDSSESKTLVTEPLAKASSPIEPIKTVQPIAIALPTARLEPAQWVDLKPQQNKSKGLGLMGWVVVVFGSWTTIVYFFESPDQRPAEIANTRTVTAPLLRGAAVESPKANFPSPAASTPTSSKQKIKGNSKRIVNNATVADCLKLISDQRMIKCLETAK